MSTKVKNKDQPKNNCKKIKNHGKYNMYHVPLYQKLYMGDTGP